MKLHKHQKLQDAFDLFVRQQNALLPDEETLSTITFSDNFKLRMKKLLSRQRQGFFVLFGTVGRRVASIAVAVLVAASVATVSVKALRDPVAQFFAEVYEKFTQVLFVDDTPDVPEVEMEKRVPTYIPEGYTVESELDVGTYYKITYINKKGEKLRYSQRWKSAGEMITDTEGVQYTVIEINGCEGITYSNKETVTITFSDEEYTYTLSSSLALKELVNVAESLKI